MTRTFECPVCKYRVTTIGWTANHRCPENQFKRVMFKEVEADEPEPAA